MDKVYEIILLTVLLPLTSALGYSFLKRLAKLEKDNYLLRNKVRKLIVVSNSLVHKACFVRPQDMIDEELDGESEDNSDDGISGFLT